MTTARLCQTVTKLRGQRLKDLGRHWVDCLVWLDVVLLGDLRRVIELMLATGARIGEVLALRWSDIDFNAGIVEVNATIKTETGKGTFREPLATERVLQLSEFATAVLNRRRHTAGRNPVDAVFSTRNGTWQQVNNVERRWRQVRQEAGLEWVTPHAFRDQPPSFRLDE